MIRGYSASAVRNAEAPYLAADVPLMERAAFALARVALQELRRRGPVRAARAVVLAGRGNNGADGILAAASLVRRGVQVTVVPVFGTAPQFTIDRIEALGGRVLVPTDDQELLDALRRADLIFDAMIGTGSDARPALRSPARELIVELKRHWGTGGTRPVVIAVDLPSGVDATTGEVSVPEAVLSADVTVTFAAAKAGLLCDPAAGFTGRLVAIDIGIDDELVQHQVDVCRLELADLRGLGIVATPRRDSHKYTRGVLGIAAGSAQYPGAAVLTVGGALRTGVGMVRYLGPNIPRDLVLGRYPEVVAQPGRVQALVAGPGVSVADARALTGHIRDMLDQDMPLVLDAGALSLVGGSVAQEDDSGDASPGESLADELPSSVVLTPHAGELVQLMESRGVTTDRATVQAAPLLWARRAHEILGATVLLKGPTTIIAGPGVTYSQADGPSWLATAGAGDVLAGVIGALLASHDEQCRDEPGFAAQLAAAGALIHGTAAQLAAQWIPGGTGPVVASDIVDHIPYVIADALQSGQSVGQ